MKTQKIAVMGESRGDFDVIDVPATIVDIGSEYVTFVHRDARYYDESRSNPHYFSHWHVSEQSTGTIVAVGVTRKLAIENATKKLREVGRENMKYAVDRQAAYLKECNVALSV